MAYPGDWGLGAAQWSAKSVMGSNTVPSRWTETTLRRSMGQSFFPYFVTYFEDLQKGPGDTIYVPLLWNCESHAGTAALVSGTSIPVYRQLITRQSVSVSEYGNGISAERFLVDLSQPDIPAGIAETIARDWSHAVDSVVAACFDTCANIVYVMASGSCSYGSFDANTAGAGRLNPTGTLDGDVLGNIWDGFRGAHAEYIVPPINIPGVGEYYALLANPAMTRTIKKSAGWTNLQLYDQNGAGIMNSVVGIYEGFLIYETNRIPTAGTAYAFGQDAVAMAAAIPMELHYYPDWQFDARRSQAWKWYSVYGVGLALGQVGTHLFKVMI